MKLCVKGNYIKLELVEDEILYINGNYNDGIDVSIDIVNNKRYMYIENKKYMYIDNDNSIKVKDVIDNTCLYILSNNDKTISLVNDNMDIAIFNKQCLLYIIDNVYNSNNDYILNNSVIVLIKDTLTSLNHNTTTGIVTFIPYNNGVCINRSLKVTIIKSKDSYNITYNDNVMKVVNNKVTFNNNINDNNYINIVSYNDYYILKDSNNMYINTVMNYNNQHNTFEYMLETTPYIDCIDLFTML